MSHYFFLPAYKTQTHSHILGSTRVGYPPIAGRTILEKRRYVRDHHDDLRLMLMAEPRGHYDMYGAILVEKDIPEADLAVLFMHNEGQFLLYMQHTHF